MQASLKEHVLEGKCTYCENSTGYSQIQIPYASKLLIHELMSMSITPRLFTDNF